MLHQLDVADAVEETLEFYQELTFPALEERVCEHPRVGRITVEWGRDRVHDMICYAMGFKKDLQTNKYVPGSRDSHLKECVLKVFHFLKWRYEEGKLQYQPEV
jgi:hypothetical protein